MLNIVSILFGLVSLVIAIVGIIPLLGWLNWFNLLIAGAGILFGSASSSNIGRNFCIIVFIISALRLSAGGGLI